MARLENNVLAVAFYVLTNLIIVKSDCTIMLKFRYEDLCTDIKFYHKVYADHTLITVPNMDKHYTTIKCNNVNFNNELIGKYELNNTIIQFIGITNSVVSTKLPFIRSCHIELNNSTLNMSNTQLFSECSRLRSLYIRSNNLTTFDIDPISSLIILDLSNNKLTSLNTEKFRKFKLDILNVSSNQISNIYCENVRFEIDLSNNGLDVINCTFATTLKHLYLNNNKLGYISNNTFKDLYNLKLLDLSNNRLVEIPSIISDLNSLVTLKLSNNILNRLQFGCFENLKSLLYLDLSFNEIEKLSYGVFTGLDKLQTIDLSCNDILEVDVGVFYPFTTLRELQLEGNLLQDVNIDVLRRFVYLNEISFSFHDISCQKLKNYIDILNNNNVEVKSGDNFYSDNINGIKCTVTNTTDLYKSSFELSLKSLMTAHITLTIIAICFLIIMIMFVVVLYFKCTL